MKIHEFIANIHAIHFPEGSPQVIETVADEFIRRNPGIESKSVPLPLISNAGVLNIAIADPQLKETSDIGIQTDRSDDFIFVRLQTQDSGWIVSSHAHYIFSFISYLLNDLSDNDIDRFSVGEIITPAFKWQRISYDYFLTQEGRIQRNLDRDSYIRELARLGFTHIEVNGLASSMSLETGPKGETYPMFYTYCPALDQFVYSTLNRGLYPYYYLSANLDNLKKNAELAVKYGLTPGLLCFEPRSVPERFFDKYPMLRGARVDHPFRSFKPRYNMTITHPKVREHYAEMMRKLLQEVPEIGFIGIWTNDSGAGFEHTKSLYVGRNGGAYLIREWKDDEEIARLAGESALMFFRTLRDAGREINPDFRVITRMESFYGEHDTVWQGLGNGVDVETASLIARGWDSPYSHPRYPDSNSINAGTVYQNRFDEKEKSFVNYLRKKEGYSHFYFAAGPHSMFEPLLGIPYPTLTWQKLKDMKANGVDYLAHSGGTFPRQLVPYNVNHEITRLFTYDPALDIEKTIEYLAQKWVGDETYSTLIKAWRLTEDAIMAFPNITPLYSTLGFTWYRLWVRPFVPDIEAIPQEQRRYYEEFMCTTPHNPNNVDLSRDVLFRLTTPDKSRLDVDRIDCNVWKPINEAIEMLEKTWEMGGRERDANDAIRDQLIRIKALHCWFMTQRNVAAWIVGVYGYMAARNESERKHNKDFLKDSINREIANSQDLMEFLRTDVEFMALTDQGETPLMYGNNLEELVARRIELMRAHINDEPFIDHDYIERKAGEVL